MFSYKIVDSEPITLEEAKAHLRVIGDRDDQTIESLISVAREYAENCHDKVYTGKKVVCEADYLGDYVLPVEPVIGIDSVFIGNTDSTSDFEYSPETNTLSYVGSSDNEEVEEGENSNEEPNGEPDGEPEPVEVTITYTTEVSEASRIAKQAMLMLIGHWYENREAVTMGSMSNVPFSAKALLDMERHGAM